MDLDLDLDLAASGWMGGYIMFDLQIYGWHCLSIFFSLKICCVCCACCAIWCMIWCVCTCI